MTGHLPSVQSVLDTADDLDDMLRERGYSRRIHGPSFAFYQPDPPCNAAVRPSPVNNPPCESPLTGGGRPVLPHGVSITDMIVRCWWARVGLDTE